MNIDELKLKHRRIKKRFENLIKFNISQSKIDTVELFTNSVLEKKIFLNDLDEYESITLLRNIISSTSEAKNFKL